MANVVLDIGGRSYTIACAEGEQAHIRDLARGINQRLATMGDLGAQSESRMLLFAALLTADALDEKERKLTQSAARPAVPHDDRGAERLLAIAERLENIAMQLETERDLA